MIKGSKVRKARHPIEPLLLARWSPRAMSGEEISQEELMRLFEAVRWAPSSFNAQQWRALYARVAALTIGRRSLICSPPQTSQLPAQSACRPGCPS
jgi:hypothetical protein